MLPTMEDKKSPCPAPSYRFDAVLIEIEACAEAIEWVGDWDLALSWEKCHRGDWMYFLFSKVIDSRLEMEGLLIQLNGELGAGESIVNLFTLCEWAGMWSVNTPVEELNKGILRNLHDVANAMRTIVDLGELERAVAAKAELL